MLCKCFSFTILVIILNSLTFMSFVSLETIGFKSIRVCLVIHSSSLKDTYSVAEDSLKLNNAVISCLTSQNYITLMNIQNFSNISTIMIN